MDGEWIPQTQLGVLVREGKLTDIDAVLNSGLPLREVEIIEVLLPDLEEEVLDVNMVQRIEGLIINANHTDATKTGADAWNVSVDVDDTPHKSRVLYNDTGNATYMQWNDTGWEYWNWTSNEWE